jgi:hypothetical protein
LARCSSYSCIGIALVWTGARKQISRDGYWTLVGAIALFFEDEAVKDKGKKDQNDKILASITKIDNEWMKLRDADSQEEPFPYVIGRHALETLALRYGIPHLTIGDGIKAREAETIRIQKIRHIEGKKYEAILPDYRDRKVIAILEKGTNYVKTFYPLTGKQWFDENSNWELSLKGNKGFSIKEIAKMHLDLMNSRK